MKKPKKVSYTVYIRKEIRDLCKYLSLKLGVKENEVVEEALIELKKAKKIRMMA